MYRAYLAALAMAAFWSYSASADKADSGIGMLTCTLGGVGEAPASEEASREQTRQALCAFTPKMGAEESYEAKVQGISVSQDEKGALIWVVRSTSGSAADPGQLQQLFMADSTVRADQDPPLIGRINADIALHSLSDKTEGSATTPERPRPTGFVIRSIELTLKSTSG